MIRSNKRRPGSISITPAINRNRDQFYTENRQNQELKLDRVEHQHDTTQILQGSNKYGRVVDRQQTMKKRRSTEVQELNLSQAGITDLQYSIDGSIQLQMLKIVCLSNNRIESFPASIFNKLTNMTHLYIDNNCLQKISFPYFKVNKITVVNISCNQLVSLNMEHLQIMKELNCSQNSLTFLTLPPSLSKLDASHNNLSNLYFVEHCQRLNQLDISHNLLYDLKLNFRSLAKRREEEHPGQVRYKYLQVLDCSHNKIQHFQGLINVINLKTFLLNNNQVSISRNIINQFLTLQSLQQLDIYDNPLNQAGFTDEDIYSMLCSKLNSLKRLNGQQLHDGQTHSYEGYASSDKKSQFSALCDEPYQLFMESSSKKNSGPKVPPEAIDWNFTLGDCDNESHRSSKINQLSYIEELNDPDCLSIMGKQKAAKPAVDRVQHKHMMEDKALEGIFGPEQKEIKLTLIKQSTEPSLHNHVHYQPYLKSLLPLSYIPPNPILINASKITSRRLDEQDDDFILISRMFMSRGGVVYVKKLSAWVVDEGQQKVFGKHSSDRKTPHMCFLLNDLSEKQFRQRCKFNILLKRQPNDIMGLQPNVFSCFHMIVRFNPHVEQPEYLCAYLIESAHF